VVLLSEGSLLRRRHGRIGSALPRNTVVFDVSPAADYEAAASLLKGASLEQHSMFSLRYARLPETSSIAKAVSTFYVSVSIGGGHTQGRA